MCATCSGLQPSFCLKKVWCRRRFINISAPRAGIRCSRHTGLHFMVMVVLFRGTTPQKASDVLIFFPKQDVSPTMCTEQAVRRWQRTSRRHIPRPASTRNASACDAVARCIVCVGKALSTWEDIFSSRRRLSPRGAQTNGRRTVGSQALVLAQYALARDRK